MGSAVAVPASFLRRAFGGGVLVGDLAVGGKDDDGIEQGGEDDLGGLAGVDEFVGGGLAVERAACPPSC